MASSSSNNPSLVAKALAKAQSVEMRLNALIPQSSPTLPTVVYTANTTVVTQGTDGNYTWTCPAGVTSAIVECWGAGAGGGGGSSGEGGEGGGGGGYSQEPLFVTVPGTVYNYTVGNGGTGGPTSAPGTSGGDTYFNKGGTGVNVYAYGGSAGGSFTGGAGGIESGNSVSSAGGNGGGDGSQGTGGCGGGGSGGSSGNGGSGTDSSGSTGSAGGSAGSGGGAAGGHGGNSTANGSTGSAPGAGGGGAGAASGGTTISNTYSATGNRSYYGSDGSNPNATRTTNGTLYHGGETATGGSYNGTQKSIITFDAGKMASDFSGATITSCGFQIICEHAWYGSGLNIQIKEWPTSGGAPPTWNGLGAPLIFDSFIAPNEQKTFNVGATVGSHFISGTTHGIAIGPGPNAFDVNWYGYFKGGSSPGIIMTGTIGSVAQAGAGSDGQVRITYTTPATLVAAVQPTAVTDASGNALAAGFTGQITAVVPGSNPAVLDSWNHVAGATGWSSSGNGVAGFFYRMNPDGFAEAVFDMTATAQNTGSIMIAASGIPSLYCPNGAASGVNAGTACIYGTLPAGSGVPYLEVLNNGSVKFWNTGQSANGTFQIAGYIRWWPGTV